MKLEHAARQALEALERLPEMCGIEEAITALREALDHFRDATKKVAMNLNCKSVQARLATSWGYVKAEQAEQEPVAWNDLDEDELAHKLGWRIGDPLYMTIAGIGQEAIHHFKAQNTAPVRTKDLTDDEIRAMFNGYVAPEILLMFRAVIAADREKNK